MTLSIALVDLQELSEETREAEARRLASRESRRPFDLATGPLVRAVLIRLAHEHHVALFNMHHIVSDAWSVAVFMNDLMEAYFSMLGGSQPEFEPLEYFYHDYVEGRGTTSSMVGGWKFEREEFFEDSDEKAE